MTKFAHVITHTDPDSSIQAIVIGLRSCHPFADVGLLEEALDNKSIIGTVLVDGISQGLSNDARFVLINFNGFRCDRESVRFIDASALEASIKDRLNDFYTNQQHAMTNNMLLTTTQRTALLQG